MSDDWQKKADFLWRNKAKRATWDSAGDLTSLELSDGPPPSDDQPAEERVVRLTPESESAKRRRLALGAVGGLKRVRE